MKGIRTSYLLDRIADVRSRFSSAPTTSETDTFELVLEATAEVRTGVALGELERRIVAAAGIDLLGLRPALTILRRIPEQLFGLEMPDGQQFDVAVRMQRLEGMIEGLQTPDLLAATEVQLRLWLLGDPSFSGILMALRSRPLEVDDLRALVRAKLALLSDSQALEVWARCQADVSADRENRFEFDAGIATEEFFEASMAELRDRISEYACWVRPQLERRAIERGQTRVPAESIGIARMLSWTSASAGIALSEPENVLVRSIARIAVWWSARRDVALFAAAAGLNAEGPLLRGRLFHEAERLREELSSVPVVLDELRQLVRVAGNLTGGDSAVMRALHAYKLGREVMGPKEADVGSSHSELWLQRHLCRFLVEREIPAWGTKFGGSEVDIRTEDDWSIHIVEAKRFKTPPSQNKLLSWATQLLSYMDVEPLNRCGVLALYNFSLVPIFAPRTFFRGRISVLPIILCSGDPSQRKRSLMIEPPQSEHEIFRVISVGV
jgi:hypothetical protein